MGPLMISSLQDLCRVRGWKKNWKSVNICRSYKQLSNWWSLLLTMRLDRTIWNLHAMHAAWWHGWWQVNFVKSRLRFVCRSVAFSSCRWSGLWLLAIQCEVLCSVLCIPYVCWCRHIRSRRERLFLVHTSRCLLAYRVIRRRRQTYVATTTASHWPHHRELMYQRQQHQLQQHSTQRRLRLFLHQFRRHLETVLLPPQTTKWYEKSAQRDANTTRWL